MNLYAAAPHAAAWARSSGEMKAEHKLKGRIPG